MSEPESKSDLLLFDVRDGTAVLTLNRPEARNALSIALQDALIAALRDVEERDDIGAAVLTGAGSAFCAGFDLKEIGAGVGGGDGAGRQGELAALIDRVR